MRVLRPTLPRPLARIVEEMLTDWEDEAGEDVAPFRGVPEGYMEWARRWCEERAERIAAVQVRRLDAIYAGVVVTAEYDVACAAFLGVGADELRLVVEGTKKKGAVRRRLETEALAQRLQAQLEGAFRGREGDAGEAVEWARAHDEQTQRISRGTTCLTLLV